MAKVGGMNISVDKNESVQPSSSGSLHKYSPAPHLRVYKSYFHHVSNNKKYLTDCRGPKAFVLYCRQKNYQCGLFSSFLCN